MKKVMLAIIVISGLATVLAATVQVTLAQGTTDKITICHAAGLAGTTHFETLNLPPSAVYANAQGNGGHFFENGTTAAGHEQDYFGPCIGDGTTGSTGTTGTTGTVPDDDEPPGTTGTTTTGTTCVGCGPGQQTAPTTTSSGPRCPPGFEPTAGKDGEAGNDECERPDTPSTSTTSSVVTETPPVTTTTTTPTTTTPDEPRDTAGTEDEPKPDPAPINPSGEKVPPVVCVDRGGAMYQGTCYPKKYGGPVLPGQQG